MRNNILLIYSSIILIASQASSIQSFSQASESNYQVYVASPYFETARTGTRLNTIHVGQEAMLVISLVMDSGSSLAYTAIIDIRNSDGVTVNLYSKEGTLNSGIELEDSIPWQPDSTGEFEIRYFIISNAEKPEILSEIQSTKITVDDQQIPTEPDDNTEDTIPIPESGHDSIANYTVLIYVIPSNLESNGYYATQDLQEMMTVGSSKNVNILVQTGGSAHSTIDEIRFIDFTKVQRHIVMKDTIRTVQDLGEQNMATSKTLADFVQWGAKEFPAERYAIILWDHGAGLFGFGYDDIHNDTLTLDEIQEGLEPIKRNGKKFELIGFDACLMASVEVANRLYTLASFLIASEEVEPAWGWDYAAVLGALERDPGQDGKELGKVIADSYLTHSKEKSGLYEDFGIDQFATMSVIDLTKIQDLVRAVDGLGDSFASSYGDKETTYSITKSVRMTERYADGGRDSSGHVDLYHFSENVGNSFDERRSVSNQVMKSVQEAVVYHVGGDARPDSHGLSIYLQVQDYEGNAPYLRHIIGSWVAVFDFNRKVLSNDNRAPDMILSMEKDQYRTISGEIRGEDTATVSQFYTQEVPGNNLKLKIVSIVDNDASEFSEDFDSTGDVDFVWDEKLASLCNIDEKDCQPISIWFEKNGNVGFAFVDVRLESTHYNGSLLLTYLTQGNGEFEFIGGWPGIDESGNAERELVPLLPGDKVYVSFLELVYQPVDDEYRFDIIESREPIVVDDGFGPTYHRYPGEYQLLFSACDYSGNCGFSNEFRFSVE